MGVLADSLPDTWTCGNIGVSCSKVECSLEDADCECHGRIVNSEVVLLSANGTITARYCSPAGAGAALGLDASVICSYAEDMNARPVRVSSLVVYGSDKATVGLDAAAQTPAVPSMALPGESRLPKPHVQLARLLRAECLNPLFARPGSRWFLRPVNTQQFPRYRDVVVKPMDLSTIRTRVDQYKYRNPVDFLADIDLIASNSLI